MAEPGAKDVVDAFTKWQKSCEEKQYPKYFSNNYS